MIEKKKKKKIIICSFSDFVLISIEYLHLKMWATMLKLCEKFADLKIPGNFASLLMPNFSCNKT